MLIFNSFDLHLIIDGAIVIALSKSLEYFVVKAWTKFDSRNTTFLDTDD